MFRKTLIAVAATAPLALAVLGASTPALANYSYCTENPSAVGCPGNFDVTKEAFYTPPSHKAAQHHAEHMRPRHG
jgi:hypothetical protein